MKKYIFFILFLTSFFVFPKDVLAKVMLQENGNLLVAQTEVIDDDLFISAENVTISGAVTGSVFAGAGTVDVKGKIGGDLLLGSGKVTITGSFIDGDIYIGAGDVTITGSIIGGNVVIGGGSVTIDTTSNIKGSLIAGAGNLRNSATIGRNAMIGSGNIYMNSKVGKEAHLAGGTIELGESSIIAGNLMYIIGEENGQLTQNPSSSVGGSTTRYTPPITNRDMQRAKNDFWMARYGWLFVSFLGALLVGMIAIKLLPKTVRGVSLEVSGSTLKSLGVGFLIVVFIFPVLLVLAISVIGLPLAGLLLGMFWIKVYMAKLVASYALGSFVAKQFNWNKMSGYAIFLIGLAIFYILRMVPMAGWVASCLFTWVGLGAIWLYGRSNLKNL